MTTPLARRRTEAAGLLLALAAVLLAGGSARAEQPGRVGAIGAAARAVARAFDAGDTAQVKALARGGATDPWLVVEELGYLGRGAVAAAFAADVPGKTGAALVAYAAARARRAPETAVRAVLVAVVDALKTGRAADARAAADGLDGAPDSVMRLQIRAGRAHALRRLGRPEASMRAFDDTARATEALGWLPEAARLYRQAGRSAFHGALWKAAEERYQRALGIYMRLEETKRSAELTASVALALARQARYAESLERYARALTLFEETGHRVGVIEVLYNAGEIRAGLGHSRDALADFRRGLALAEARRDGPRVVRGLLDVGAALLGLGRHREALAPMQHARELAARLGDRARVSGALSNIGIAYLGLGDYAAALEIYHAALAAAEAAKSRADVAIVLQNTGALHARLGQDEEALTCYRRALDIAEALGDGRQSGALLGNIGNVHHRLGRNEEAESHLRRALEVAERVGDQPRIASALTNLASLYSATGRQAEALGACRRAVALAEATGNTALAAAMHAQAGVVHERTGRYAEALAALDTALGLLGETPVPDTYVRVLWAQARVRLAQGRPADAAALARRAVARLASLAQGLADQEGASAREVFAGLFETGMRGALRARDTSALAWFFEQGRAGMLREGLGARDALAAAVVPAPLREEVVVAQAAERRALAALREARRKRAFGAVRTASRALTRAREAVEAAVARVQREAKKAAALVFPTPDDVDTIRARLAPDEALLLYGLTKEEALVLVLRRDTLRTVTLGASQRIDAAVEALLLDGAPHIEPAAVGALRALVAQPVQLADDVHRVLVSPMGRLGYVPFALLFPERDVAYVPSGTTHGLLRERGAGGGRAILALGDPAYGTVAPAVARVHRGGNTRRLPPLPATRLEVEAVGTVRLLGPRASEAGLREALRSRAHWRALHFACHGLLDPERPALSSLALTPDAEHDGFLTCLEVLRMPVPADLVVLSACETGKGRIYLTEGIVGLARAFMFAGSPRVICSLWKVDDDATRVLMTRFYELWNPREGGGSGAAAALRAAQAHVRSYPQWQHPAYWAAWVLWGRAD